MPGIIAIVMQTGYKANNWSEVVDHFLVQFEQQQQFFVVCPRDVFTTENNVFTTEKKLKKKHRKLRIKK